MKIDRAETLRYLRMGGVEPDAPLARRLARVEDDVRAACRPAAYWRLETVAAGEETGDLVLGPLAVRSHDLARVLAGCRHAFLFCATLGAGVDALLRRYSQTSGADALMAQAAATAAIEGWCDACAEKLLAEIRRPAARGAASASADP